LARALDQLDKSMNRPKQFARNNQQSQSGEQGGKPGEQGGKPGEQGGKPGEQGGKPGQQGGGAQQQGQRALMEAAMAQAQLMAQVRAEGLRPGQKPQGDGSPQNAGQGEGAQGNPPDAEFNLAELPDFKKMGLDDWAKLKPKEAKELLERQRESLSPEFRKQIYHYFRIIGERARARQNDPQKK
jgi:hypothetical protein